MYTDSINQFNQLDIFEELDFITFLTSTIKLNKFIDRESEKI